MSITFNSILDILIKNDIENESNKRKFHSYISNENMSLFEMFSYMDNNHKGYIEYKDLYNFLKKNLFIVNSELDVMSVKLYMTMNSSIIKNAFTYIE